MNKILKYLKNPFHLFGYLGRRGVFNWMPDSLYLKILYRIEVGYWPNLSNPQTFNEKLQWLKIHDRKPEYTQFVDKYEVRKHIAETIGEEYLIPLLGVWDKFDDIDFSKLPEQFVLKCTHDSGGLVICKDKSNLDIKRAKKKIERCLKKNYYWDGREWPYKSVKSRIIAEKYMVDESETELKDYKIFCFDGESKIIQVDFDRFVEHKRNLYDTEWNLCDFTLLYKNGKQKQIPKPAQLEKMLEFAKTLSKNIPFVRVDFYCINNDIRWGGGYTLWRTHFLPRGRTWKVQSYRNRSIIRRMAQVAKGRKVI
ncbi:glycosyl transferase [Fibrobacterales bacterium]|nr:glycosyl transferase [Fibrobacterales bacterium]